MSLSPVPVHTLTTENLRQFPVWRYLHDDEGGEGTDESFVTPADEVPPAGGYGSFVVAATYLLHGGDELPGAVQLDLLGAKRQFTPILLHAAGKGLDPLASDVTARLSRLQRTPGGPPIRWTLDITLSGDTAPASGRIYRSRALQALALFVQLVSLFFAPRGR
ncbi:MAG: hypothetical protein KA538_05055 [Azonexus sp.]|jgi:hypothetical protein|nr:hypothetical protein [Azonexus sp.]